VRSPSAFFERYKHALRLPSTVVSFSKTFVALAAPSLEGKTQTAFTLRSANVLLFVMAAAYIGEGRIQQIYEPFIKHSTFLHRLAEDDLVTIGVSVTVDDQIRPSTTDLTVEHRDKSLLVLGYFLQIMKQTVDKRR
jgi:hypothetical protein